MEPADESVIPNQTKATLGQDVCTAGIILDGEWDTRGGFHLDRTQPPVSFVLGASTYCIGLAQDSKLVERVSNAVGLICLRFNP